MAVGESIMDRVRLGRALGYGVRQAAKTAVAVVEAAATPDPRALSRAGEPKAGAEIPAGTRPATQSATRPATNDRLQAARRTASQVGRQGKGIWSLLARFSGVLWLEVTGTFFALMAAFLGQGVWRQRAAFALGLHAPEAQRLALSAAAFGVFAYFALSSFVKASRRGRR